MSATVSILYVLFLPTQIRVYESLNENTTWDTYSASNFWPDTTKIYVPIDLITAARLKLIKPHDESGIGDEQWAWMKLIGLTGEN